MEETNNCLEILVNLIYLARHSAGDAAAVERYLAEAEIQALQLAKLHCYRTRGTDEKEENDFDEG